MDVSEIERLLRAFKSGELGEQEAARAIGELGFEDIGHTRVDHARAARQGFPEVVFGAGKTRAQVVEIVERLAARAPNVLVTRTDEGTFGEVRNVCNEAEWHASARMIRIRRDREERGVGPVLVVTAGTSDIPVAEEAALTAEAMGNRVERVWDAGVAGIHRIMAERERLRAARERLDDLADLRARLPRPEDDLGETLPGGPRVVNARVPQVFEVEVRDATRRLRLVQLALLEGAQKPFEFSQVHKMSGQQSAFSFRPESSITAPTP